MHTQFKMKELLFHGMSQNHFEIAIKNNFLTPHTSQRFHKTNHIVMKHMPEYDDCEYRFGWSFTRNIDVAKRFGGSPVIIVFDKSELRKNHKIVPVDWNAQRPENMRLNNEHEEFVCSGGYAKSPNYFKNKIIHIEKTLENSSLSDEKYKLLDSEYSSIIDYKMFYSKPTGKALSLKNLLGFYLVKDEFEYYKNIKELTKNSLFLGFV